MDHPGQQDRAGTPAVAEAAVDEAFIQPQRPHDDHGSIATAAESRLIWKYGNDGKSDMLRPEDVAASAVHRPGPARVSIRASHPRRGRAGHAVALAMMGLTEMEGYEHIG